MIDVEGTMFEGMLDENGYIQLNDESVVPYALATISFLSQDGYVVD